MKIVALLCVIILSLFSRSNSQEVQLKAQVSSNQVALDQRFQYSVEVSGSSTSLPQVSFPDFSEFYVLSGPNTSTSIQMVNGAMSSAKTFSFILQPQKEGKLIITPASVDIKGSKISSNSVTISVSKTAGSQSNKKQQTQVNRKDAEIGDNNLFLKTKVSRTKAYIGEQITVEYRLYFRVQVRGYDPTKIPASTGFWAEEFKLPAQPAIESEIVNGINYRVATLRKIALFPTRAGELTLEPMVIKVEAVAKEKQRRRSIFDSFFENSFDRLVSQTISSKPVKINVSKLPLANRPVDFTGAVGEYKFIVGTDKTEINVNEAISLKMAINGVGNIKLIDLPQINIPQDIEQYDPKVSTKINNGGKFINGSKQSEYVLIPRVPGAYTIKPVSFSFFNPLRKQYQTITNRAIQLKVTGTQTMANGGSAAGGGYSRQVISLLGKDIRFIKESTEFIPVGQRSYLSVPFWSIFFLAFIGFLGVVFLNEYHAKVQNNERLARSRKAGKLASRHLAEAKKKLNLDKQDDFYKAVSSALRGFVQDKLGIELTDFSSHSIKANLQKQGVEVELIKDYVRFLDESDFRQFASISDSKDERQDFFNQAKNVLTKLEKRI